MKRYKIEIIRDEERDVDLFIDLENVWLDSVSVTHRFLSVHEIVELKPYVRAELEQVNHLVVIFEDDDPVGFMGVDEGKIEMLFISPELIRKGLGREFIKVATEHLGATKVDVNEQNTNAVGFYEHVGFVTYDRSEIDDQGKPRPLLRMKLRD